MRYYEATLFDSREVIARSNGRITWVRFAHDVQDMLDQQERGQGFDIYNSKTGELICSYTYVGTKTLK